jgi:uncharacterized repeat protein (TIGR01451 family)
VTWHLPEHATLDPASIGPGWAWDEAARRLTWGGELAEDAGLEHEIALVLDADLPEAQHFRSWAEIIDESGLGLVREVTWRANAADLSTSAKAAPGPAEVVVGEAVPFVVAAVNTGSRSASFVVTDTLPVGLALVANSVAPAAGTTVDTSSRPGTLYWRGTVAPGQTASLSYRARVTTYNGGVLANRAWLDDGQGEVTALTATVFARPNLLLPLALHQVDTDP